MRLVEIMCARGNEHGNPPSLDRTGTLCIGIGGVDLINLFGAPE
jgi:hypothetical protein